MAAPISQSLYMPLLRIFRRSFCSPGKAERQVLDARLVAGQSVEPRSAKRPANTGEGVSNRPRNLPTVGEIREHRGETVDASNARYDLNGDGRINVADILHLRDLLNGSRSNRIRRHVAISQKPATTHSGRQSSRPAGVVTPKEPGPVQQTPTQPPTIEEIRQHRGETVDQSNARYDLNGDGRINVADILAARDRG